MSCPESDMTRLPSHRPLKIADSLHRQRVLAQGQDQVQVQRQVLRSGQHRLYHLRWRLDAGGQQLRVRVGSLDYFSYRAHQPWPVALQPRAAVHVGDDKMRASLAG